MRAAGSEPSLAPLLIGTAVVLTVALVSIVPAPWRGDDDASTAAEGRAVIVDLVADTSRMLDVRGWWPQSGAPGLSTCTRSDGTPGASYDYNLWAPRQQLGQDDESRAAARERDARMVAEQWESLGMTTYITATATRFPTVYGTGGPVRSASFDTGAAEKAYRIGMQAHCSEGSISALKEEDIAQRAAGVVLPGDEGVLERNDPRREQMFIPTP